MSSLLNNAAQSLRVGVEDYLSNDPGRTLSAVRNITAGILLLFKEKLRQLSPPESDEVLLKQKVNPSLKKDGLVFLGSGKKTVDVQEIRQRFDSLGIQVDWKRVSDIVAIRNNIEHYYTEEPTTRLRELIADTFLLVRDFSTLHLNITPVDLLGDKTWKVLLETAEVYAKELEECQVERAKIRWPGEILASVAEHVRCPQCDSELLKPLETTRQDWYSLPFRCSHCGKSFPFEELAEGAVEECLAAEAHISIKDGGESPYEQCPDCGRETYLVADAVCAACGYEVEFSECPVCGASLSVQEQEFGGLCSYHHYVAERERDT